MNSETIPHYVSDIKKTKWKVSTKKTITWKEGIDCNINDKFSIYIVSNIWVPTPNTSNKFKYIEK